jgi:threonine synthase
LLTASGLKDPGPIETALPEPPLVSGGLTELLAALKNAYGFAHG